MVIELIGLPGSGKTFLCNNLIEEKNFKKVENKKPTKKHKLKSILKVLFSKVLIVYYLKVTFSFNNIFDKLRRFYGLAILSDYINSKTKIIVYDQHLLQYLISFYMVTKIKPREKDLLSLLKHYKFSEHSIVIYNDIDINIVAQRFQDRKNSLDHNKTLLDNLNREQMINSLSKLKILNDKLVEMLKELDMKVIHWTSPIQSDIELLKQEIKNKINE